MVFMKQSCQFCCHETSERHKLSVVYLTAHSRLENFLPFRKQVWSGDIYATLLLRLHRLALYRDNNDAFSKWETCFPTFWKRHITDVCTHKRFLWCRGCLPPVASPTLGTWSPNKCPAHTCGSGWCHYVITSPCDEGSNGAGAAALAASW